MEQNFNSGEIPDDFAVDGESSLADALEELLQGRFSRAAAAPSESVDLPIPRTGLGFLPSAESTPCPDPAELLASMGEDSDDPHSPGLAALLAHLAGCRACSDRLRLFSADATEEESAFLADLACASTAGQHRLAVELAQTRRLATPRLAPRSRVARVYLWAGAGLAASLMIAVGLSAWWRAANNPERLLAQAYTDSRIFDMRMPGAGFAEVTPEMNLRTRSTEREPATLQEAKSRIAHRLEAAPNDAHWQQLEARSDILEQKFDDAIAILDPLVVAEPANASLILDDASAYFQRGVATDTESDRAHALNALRRADELAPGDPVVLFNEAVAMEDRGQLINAVETWNRYLHFERDSKWQAEGRHRLDALEQKLNQLKSHAG
jgi:tetratricopeptide (TPR) repeat protein